MRKANTIYLDMDGVLCDFSRRYKELFHMDPKEAEQNKKFDKFFNEFIETQQFAKLDWMPGAQGLLAVIKTYHGVDVEILSSTANETRYETISRQKSIWLDNHGIHYKRNYVPGKRFKYHFARPDAIIIDDTESVIRDWNNAGGIGILHTSLSDTMAQLKKHGF